MNVIEVKKIKRSFCVVVGSSVLAKFPTEDQARKSLETKLSYYQYYAGSAAVSVENSTPTVVTL